MAIESSPFAEEQALEDSVDEELLLIFALAFLHGTSEKSLEFNTVQERFKAKVSEAIPHLQATSTKSIQIALERTSSELNIKNLQVDYADSRFMNLVLQIFEYNLGLILQTNQAMYSALLDVAVERDWSQKEFDRRLALYFGLTPRFLKTVLTMEDALKAEGVSKKVINKRLQKRIDQLVEHRIKLSSTLIGTGVVEGTKDLLYTQLVETNQVDGNKYVKEWVSVVDDVTTQICLSSNRMIAEIGGYFANGYKFPPATDPTHPCRSSTRLIKRKS